MRSSACREKSRPATGVFSGEDRTSRDGLKQGFAFPGEATMMKTAHGPMDMQ